MKLHGQLGLRGRARGAAAVGVAATVTAGVLSAAAIIGTAAPAFAKSDISISARWLAAGDLQVVVSGGDDGQPPVQQLCVDIRFPHGGWHTLRCHTSDVTTGGPLMYRFHPHRGTEFLRGQLLIPRSPHDQHPRADRTSAPVAITVR